MNADRCLLQISDWIKGNDWSDWKTRIVPGKTQNNLLIQREINRYLFEVLYDDQIAVYDMPTYDDRFQLLFTDNSWYINGTTLLTKQALIMLLAELEQSQK